MPRRGGRGRAVPRAVPDRLLDRRPVPAGHPARGGRSRRSRAGRGERGPAAGAGRRRAAAQGQPGLQLRRGHPPRRGARGRAEVVPADLPGVLRGAAGSPRARTSAASRSTLGGERGPVRPRPDLPGGRRARPGAARRDLRGHVGAGPAERRRRAGRRHRAGQPLRLADHRRPRRGPAAARPLGERALPRGVRSTPPRARGSRRTDLSWDGQTMVYECGDLLGETERFPDGPRRTVVDVDLDRIRQERLRQGTFDDNRARRGRRRRRLPRGRVHPRPARPATSACAARSTGSRSSPTTSSGSRWTATRPTTSRSPGSSSGCAPSASPRSSSASPAGSTPPTR